MNTFIIAELSGNHNGSLDIAKKTIKAIKDSGADAVKLQTYTANTITLNSNKKYFTVNDNSIWQGRKAYDIYDKAHTPWHWHKELFNLANKLDLICFSSPFDFSSVDFLEKLNCPIYKIASPEIVDIPLIKYVASKHKPIILSTGIATLEDIQLAIKTCHNENNYDITLLKCTSAYPTPMEEVNLRNIQTLKNLFNVKIGISDHTLGSSVPIASIALGAEVIEKHFILDKDIGGEDSSFSMEYKEFKYMVNEIRNIEKALGTSKYTLSQKALKSKKFQRSLFVVKDIKKGEIFTTKNIKSVRPADGLEPKYYYDILGKKASKNLEFADPLKEEDIINFKKDLNDN
jgi:pseudaminic acid synthase